MENSLEELNEQLKNPVFRYQLLEKRLRESISAQIKGMREARNLSQFQVAKAIGISLNQVKRLEDPTYKYWPTVKTLATLANFFDCALIIRFAPWGEWLQMEFNLVTKELRAVELPVSFEKEFSDS